MLIHILKQRMMKCTWRSEGSSELRRSSETTTLATGCESAEAAAACHALETTGGHFIIHTDLSAFAVSTAVLLSLWESSIFCFLRLFCVRWRWGSVWRRIYDWIGLGCSTRIGSNNFFFFINKNYIKMWNCC